MSHLERSTGFRSRLNARQAMMGTFLKTPSSIVAEVMGLSPLGCVCIDAEHAPFGRLELDACIAALRAADMPALVRVQNNNAADILSALDCGATGIIAPHIVTAKDAQELVRVSQYSTNGRGYAGSSRAANYTTKPMADHIRDSNAMVTVIAQIEDAAALDNLDEIAAVDGIDCLFVGRMDLTVSLGARGPKDALVLDAVERICDAGRRHDKAVGMFFPAGESVREWRGKGASFFLLGSDQQFMLDGARALAERLASD